MGTSYLVKDKVFAVCTYQLSADPEKFSNTRTTPTVFYQNNKQPILTVADRNLNCQFTCKSPWGFASSFLAFGAGLIIGALLLSTPLGWVALGIAFVAIGAVLAVSAAHHKCTDPLQAGEWRLTHSSVRINGQIAVTRSSMLLCGTGGILTPFFNEAEAQQAAASIADNNRGELAVNTIASFFAGFFLPEAVSGVAGGVLLQNFIAGYFFFSLGTGLEKGGIRAWNENIGDVKDNPTYENMNNEDRIDIYGLPTKPDDLTQDVTDLEKFRDAYKNGTVIINNSELASKLDALDGLDKQQLRTNPLAKQLLAELKAGKYPEWRASINSFNPRRMNPSMIDDGRAATATTFKNNFNAMLKNSGQGILFFAPFISTFFSENARKDLAEGMARDLAFPGVDIIANNPID